MAANASPHDSPTAPIRFAPKGGHGCHVPEFLPPSRPLAARVRLDLLAEWNAANDRARVEYAAHPNHFGRWPV